MVFLLSAYSNAIDRPTMYAMRKLMNFAYTYFRISPEIFVEGLFLLFLGAMVTAAAELMMFSLQMNDWPGLLLSMISFSAITFFASATPKRWARLSNEWTVKRYKQFAARAMNRKSGGLHVRLVLFLFLDVFAGNMFAVISGQRPGQSPVEIYQFLVFLTLHLVFAAEATEPPPPDEGDAFFTPPQFA